MHIIRLFFGALQKKIKQFFFALKYLSKWIYVVVAPDPSIVIQVDAMYWVIHQKVLGGDKSGLVKSGMKSML